MSVTIEDKIELFSKMIFGKIEANSSEKRQKLIETHQKELEELHKEFEKRKQEFLDIAIAKAERERAKLIAQANNQQQHMQVEQKQHIMLKIMERLQELAVGFAGTMEYQSCLRRNLEAAVNALGSSKHINLYVMERDIQSCIELCREVMTAAGRNISFDVKKATHNIIGGLIAEDTENLLQLDLTLKALIEENRDIVGAAITRRFNEVNDQ